MRRYVCDICQRPISKGTEYKLSKRPIDGGHRWGKQTAHLCKPCLHEIYNVISYDPEFHDGYALGSEDL